jgi:hypothetical protein
VECLDSMGDRRRVVVAVLDEDAEFAVEAGDGVAIAGAAEKSFGELREQRVAAAWPRVSLTCLKLSRSRDNTPVAVRTVLAGLDRSRHSVIYLPDPPVGVRGIHHSIVAFLGGQPHVHHATLVLQAADALATEHSDLRRSWSSTRPRALWDPTLCAMTNDLRVYERLAVSKTAA